MAVAPPGRCPRCWLRQERCLCGTVQVVPARTEILLVRHAAERGKNSNTGRLALLALGERARIVEYALPGSPPGVPELAGAAGDGRTWLLYPDGEPLAAPPPSLGRLVVLDGTWPQARRMRQQIPELRGMPRLALPPPVAPMRRLRQPKGAEEMSTLEAIAQALAWLEGPELAQPLFELHETFVTRAAPP